jgi:dienelactone hydrolase
VIRRRIAALLAAVALCTTLGACTGAPDASDASVSPPKTPSEVCLGGASHESSSTWIETPDGTFDVGLVGDGATTAIFVHQMDANACGWFLYAADLATQGVRSMLVNLCGSGETECSKSSLTDTGADAVLAAAERAVADGATRVVLVGASIGGTTVVKAAIRGATAGDLDGVADLSGPIIADGTDLRAVADAITVPVFLAVSPDDPVVSPEEMTGLADATSSDTITLIVDGAGHGWDMLGSPGGQAGTVGEQLAAFIVG